MKCTFEPWILAPKQTCHSQYGVSTVRLWSDQSSHALLLSLSGGEGSAETGQKETSTCDICQFGAECDVDAEDVWSVSTITLLIQSFLHQKRTWPRFLSVWLLSKLQSNQSKYRFYVKEYKAARLCLLHRPIAEHPPRVFIAWLTISFNLNYQSRAARERRFSLMLEIQLLSLQDLAMSEQKCLWLAREKLVQWWNNICCRFNHFLPVWEGDSLRLAVVFYVVDAAPTQKKPTQINRTLNWRTVSSSVRGLAVIPT